LAKKESSARRDLRTPTEEKVEGLQGRVKLKENNTNDGSNVSNPLPKGRQRIWTDVRGLMWVDLCVG
jgi:hypothetical protein